MPHAQDRAEAMGVDGLVERVGRWTARRTSRRSFLGRLGRLGVLVAGGATMATLLTETAEARVCGQSGTAPRCDTFDCDATWGWCWYASGCCADGALKKICDCCAPNTPHAVGYCPSGTRVLCIVESCGADPRVQTSPVERLGTSDPVALTVALSRARFPGRAPMAVVGDAEDAGFASIAASVGSVVAGPVLLTGRGRLDPAVAEELGRLGVEYVKVVGPQIEASVDAALASAGMEVERLGWSSDLSAFSVQIAGWSRRLTGARRAVLVLPSAGSALPVAAALATAQGMPLLYGRPADVEEALRAPRGMRITYVVSTDAEDAEQLPGGRAVSGADLPAIARALADLGLALRGGTPGPATLASGDDSRGRAAMATVPGPLLIHQPGSLDGARSWFIARGLQVSAVYVAGDAAELGDPALYELQSAINEFETHLLVGGAGDGLPVITQPPEERPIGRARR